MPFPLSVTKTSSPVHKALLDSPVSVTSDYLLMNIIQKRKKYLRDYETVHFWQYFYIDLQNHYSSFCTGSRQRGRERDLTPWWCGWALPHQEVVDRYKRLQFTLKKSIGYWKSDDTSLCKSTFSHKSALYCAIIPNSPDSILVRTIEKRFKKSLAQTDFFLSVYYSNS